MLQYFGILLAFTITVLSQDVSPASFDFGVNVFDDGLVSKKTFQCIINEGYVAASIRIYSPAERGRIDPNGKDNIMNALAAELGIEAFVHPNPLSSKSGATQFTESLQYYNTNGITISRIWLVVSNPKMWNSIKQSNVNFINSFISQTRQDKVEVGIYTSWYDWLLITGGYSVQQHGNILLWYWHTLGKGVTGKTDPGFSDFRSFGDWKKPTNKRFGISEIRCGVTVNLDAFATFADSTNENDTGLAATAFKFGNGVNVTKLAINETEERVHYANDNEKASSHLFEKIAEKRLLKD